MTKQSPALGIKSVLLSFQRLLRFARNDRAANGPVNAYNNYNGGNTISNLRKLDLL